MNQPTQIVLTDMESILAFALKQADRHGFDEIRISAPRARGLLLDIKRVIADAKKPAKRQPAWLDRPE
jgi:hypothetical protein